MVQWFNGSSYSCRTNVGCHTRLNYSSSSTTNDASKSTHNFRGAQSASPVSWHSAWLVSHLIYQHSSSSLSGEYFSGPNFLFSLCLWPAGQHLRALVPLRLVVELPPQRLISVCVTSTHWDGNKVKWAFMIFAEHNIEWDSTPLTCCWNCRRWSQPECCFSKLLRCSTKSRTRAKRPRVSPRAAATACARVAIQIMKKDKNVAPVERKTLKNKKQLQKAVVQTNRGQHLLNLHSKHKEMEKKKV